MKKALVGALALAVVMGSSGLVRADAPTFPSNFATSYADASYNKQVNVQGSELRLAIDQLDGTSVESYLIDLEQNTLSKASAGTSYTNGGAGFNGVYNQVKHDLEDIRDGLDNSGDSAGADDVQAAIDYLEDWQS